MDFRVPFKQSLVIKTHNQVYINNPLLCVFGVLKPKANKIIKI